MKYEVVTGTHDMVSITMPKLIKFSTYQFQKIMWLLSCYHFLKMTTFSLCLVEDRSPHRVCLLMSVEQAMLRQELIFTEYFQLYY